MKALLIDPFSKTVAEVEYDGKLATAYKLMGCKEVELLGLNIDPIPMGNFLLIDAEANITRGPKAYFAIDGIVITGKALTTKVDTEGDEISSDVTLQMLAAPLCWVNRVGDAFFPAP